MGVCALAYACKKEEEMKNTQLTTSILNLSNMNHQHKSNMERSYKADKCSQTLNVPNTNPVHEEQHNFVDRNILGAEWAEK